MKLPSLSLKRSLDITIKNSISRINKLSLKDSQSLKEEYKEWFDAIEKGSNHPHVLYINHINPN
tara:strand:+ start:421 stop:612 length:192 start_codon:yes stop_codon:yes gene_type:complete